MKTINERINYRRPFLRSHVTLLFDRCGIQLDYRATINKASILLGKRIGAFVIIHKFSLRNLYRIATRTKSVLRIVLVAMRETDRKKNIPPRFKLLHSFLAQTIHGQCPIHSFSLWEGSLIFLRFFFSSKLHASYEGHVRRKVSISNHCLRPAWNGRKEEERKINIGSVIIILREYS